jgi:DNA-directed RNA polymerase subunit RPC12/RpoP
MARPTKKPNYRSKLEERVCNNLRNRRIDFTYEPYQIAYTTEVRPAYCANCGHKVILKERNYTPDVVLGNGIVVEIKGKFTGEMRTKMLAVRRCNPDLDIRMLFQANNWLTRKKKQRYSDWCDRNGFIYHVGEQIPSDWVV